MSSDDEQLPRFSYVEDLDEDDTTSMVAPAAALTGRRQIPALVVVAGDQSLGRIIKLTKKQTLGRAISADVLLAEKGVSRLHAELTALPAGRVLIRDLGSSNGIRIKGKTVEQHILSEGDRVQLGDAHLVLISMNAGDGTPRIPPRIDPVTRLPSRRFLIQTLNDDIDYARSCGEGLAFCLVSVDQARSFVDVYGLVAADDALRAVAKVSLELSQGVENSLARFGPEEIAIVLPDTSLSEAQTFAESVRRAVSTTRVSFGDQRHRFTVSIGLAMFPSAGVEDALGLVTAAENSLYRAFLNGRDCVVPGLSASGRPPNR